MLHPSLESQRVAPTQANFSAYGVKPPVLFEESATTRIGITTACRFVPCYSRRRFGLAGLSQASVQNRATCFDAATRCLLMAANAGPRIFPAMALAPDSHMLKSGFFFVHKFATPKSPARQNVAPRLTRRAIERCLSRAADHFGHRAPPQAPEAQAPSAGSPYWVTNIDPHSYTARRATISAPSAGGFHPAWSQQVACMALVMRRLRADLPAVRGPQANFTAPNAGKH